MKGAAHFFSKCTAAGIFVPATPLAVMMASPEFVPQEEEGGWGRKENVDIATFRRWKCHVSLHAGVFTVVCVVDFSNESDCVV